MADSQRQKARSLVDADVLTLPKLVQKTTRTTSQVDQANMSRQGAASPQPRLTPHERPFAKGGSAKGKMKKAAAVAGMLSALTQAPMGGPAPAGMGAAPPAAAPMAGPMGAPGMKRGGRKMAMGGKATDDEGNEMRGMKRGGASHVPMKGAGNHKPAGGTGGNLVPRSKAGRVGYAKGGSAHGDEAEDKVLIRKEFKRMEASEKPGMKKGGKCMKCGGAAHGGSCKMKTGGRIGFAMGGVGKQRKNQADKAGKPTKQPRHSYEDSLI